MGENTILIITVPILQHQPEKGAHRSPVTFKHLDDETQAEVLHKLGSTPEATDILTQ